MLMTKLVLRISSLILVRILLSSIFRIVDLKLLPLMVFSSLLLARANCLFIRIIALVTDKYFTCISWYWAVTYYFFKKNYCSKMFIWLIQSKNREKDTHHLQEQISVLKYAYFWLTKLSRFFPTGGMQEEFPLLAKICSFPPSGKTPKNKFLSSH